MEGISNYYLTQGVLGTSVLALSAVVIYLQKKLDRKDLEHKQELKALNELLVSTIQQHAKDFQEVADNYQGAMSSTAQTVALFGEKIEVGRRSH